MLGPARGRDEALADDAPVSQAQDSLGHGANVLRALARNLEGLTDLGSCEPPLDHPSARDAVTLLGWRGESSSEALQDALELSQPACVRVVDRLAAADLVVRRRRRGDRRLYVGLTADGREAARRLALESRAAVECALRAALSGDELSGFVVALDRVAAVVFGDATDTVRFCRSCDVTACLASSGGCPSETACRVNLEAARR